MAASATAITAVAFIQRSGSAIIICIGLMIRRDDLVASPCENLYDEIGHGAMTAPNRSTASEPNKSVKICIGVTGRRPPEVGRQPGFRRRGRRAIASTVRRPVPAN
jgi:hypothetical protein